VKARKLKKEERNLPGFSVETDLEARGVELFAGNLKDCKE